MTLSDVWFRVTHLEVESAWGCMVRSTSGESYLDFTSGIGVASTGHCHPRVVRALQDQAANFIHAQANIYRHPILTQLTDRLATVTPEGIDKFFITNSGAEAVEGAVKLARQATSRPNVIVFSGGFHGRTAQTMAMTTAKAGYRVGHAPLPAGIHVAPFPKWAGAPGTDECLAQLDLMLHTQTAPSEVAAVVVEPVLGEGGYLPAPPDFLHGLEERCRAHGMVLVLDEVQTGFGRTGRMFASEHSGVRPDVLVMAKGMGSGFPIAAVGAGSDLMERWPQGSHGGTYGGNPMGCAAVLATLDVIRDEHLVHNAALRGEELADGLRSIAASDTGSFEVRGLGLMIGCELRTESGEPDSARAAAVVSHCRDESRVLLMTCGPDANTIRWIPPLIATSEEIRIGLEAFAKAMAA